MDAPKFRKIIFAINVTIDGFANHEAVLADDELHDFYAELLGTIDIVLFGRKTYQLLESFWPIARQDPRSTKSMLRFADKINGIQKIVFSNTLNDVHWSNTSLIKGDDVIEQILKLKNQEGNRLSISGLSIASMLTRLGLIDKYLFVVQPVILGKGTPLLKDLNNRVDLKLIEIKTFASGVVAKHDQKI
jgi:dihydrofolate reductase